MEAEQSLAPILSLVPMPTGLLLAVTFTQSKSQNYPIAVALAQGAEFYQAEEVEGTKIHFVGFGRTKEEAVRARALLRLAGSWKGTQVFGGGRVMQSAYNSDELLNCYITAASFQDHLAHCWVHHNAHPDWVHPCRLLATREILDRKSSIPPEEQVKAAALRRGVDWCPFLNVNENQ
jgi:hypothetical protein